MPSSRYQPGAEFHGDFTAALPIHVNPSTSSLELLAKDGQYMGLMAGANVLTAHGRYPCYERKQFCDLPEKPL